MLNDGEWVIEWNSINKWGVPQKRWMGYSGKKTIYKWMMTGVPLF